MFYMSEREQAVDSGDATTCPYCEHFEYVDVGMSGHVCQGMRDASQRESDAFEHRWKGTGKRIKKTLTLTIECYDTEDSIEHCIQDFAYQYPHTKHHQDDILEFKWAVK